MNSIYNNKYTFINGTGECIDSPPVCTVFNLDSKTLTDIKNQELYSHKLFSGHIILKKYFELDWERILSLDLTQNKVYSKNVFHSGIYTQCSIDLSFAVCSSWMLPFVLDDNADYSYLRKHRAKLLTYEVKTLT